jgi:hypothetical protein
VDKKPFCVCRQLAAYVLVFVAVSDPCVDSFLLNAWHCFVVAMRQLYSKECVSRMCVCPASCVLVCRGVRVGGSRLLQAATSLPLLLLHAH